MPEPSPTSGTPDTSQANPNQQQNPQHNPQYGQYGAYGPYGQPGQHYPWPRDMPRQGNHITTMKVHMAEAVTPSPTGIPSGICQKSIDS
jgi:hypothetical protein